MNTAEQANAVIMHTYSRFPLVIERGEGMYLWDTDGKRYIDFVAGIAVNVLGHCHPKLVDAINKQANTLIHVSNLYYTNPQIKLAKQLVQYTDFNQVFFCNSGAEGIEGALKLARKYALTKWQNDGKTNIVTMKNSFHGRTYGAITATGQAKYQKGFGPLLPGIDYAEFNNMASLKSVVDENTCAILVEPIQGEGGIIPADKAYLKAVRDLCDDKGILLIFDEIQTGMGRCGTLFAYQHYGVAPDILVTAKGLAGGVPMGAILAKEHVANAFVPGDHASTFGGNPLASAAGNCVLDELTCGGVIENAKKMGQYFELELKKLASKHSRTIKETRGVGLMRCLALNIPCADVINKLIADGLLVAGAGPDCIRFVPALILDESHIDEAVAIMDRCFSLIGEEDNQ